MLFRSPLFTLRAAAAPGAVLPAVPAVPAAPAASPPGPASELPPARPSVTLAGPARQATEDPGGSAVALLDRVFADPDSPFFAPGYVPDDRTS